MSREWIIDDDFLDEETKLSADGQGYLTELVRCKDCKYRQKEWYEDKRRKDGGYWIIGCGNFAIAERIYGLAHDKDYCSYGERKES